MHIEMFKELIRKRGVSVRELAKITGICRVKLFLKLTGFSEFRLYEIKKISDALCLNSKQIKEIFFDTEVS